MAQTVWRRIVRLLASNKLKATERKRSWTDLYYPGTAAGWRSRYEDCLRAGRAQVWIPGKQDFFFVSKTAGTHTPSHSMATGVHSRGKRVCDMQLTTHLYLVPRLRINGAIPLLPLHTFMVWTGPISPLPLQSCHHHGRIEKKNVTKCRVTTVNLRDGLILASPEQEAGLLTTRPRRSVLLSLLKCFAIFLICQDSQKYFTAGQNSFRPNLLSLCSWTLSNRTAD